MRDAQCVMRNAGCAMRDNAMRRAVYAVRDADTRWEVTPSVSWG